MSTSRLGEGLREATKSTEITKAEINEESPFGLITAPHPGTTKPAAASQIQHGPSSGSTISDQLSHLAVIDNQNTLNINIQHERVKGYKGLDPSRTKVDQDKFKSANGLVLDDDIIFEN